MSESKDRNENRRDPYSEAFKTFIVSDWEPYSEELPGRLPSAPYAAERRKALAEQFPGATLLIPAGPLKTRTNDTDYRFRPHSAFAYYTGLGEDREPDAVLVIAPEGSVMYFRPRAPRTDREFYADPRYGEMWVGQRDSLDEMSAAIDLPCLSILELDQHLDGRTLLVVREADPAITALVDATRATANEEGDEALARAVSEARFRKDAYEISELERACDATRVGFEAVVRELPEAVRHGRGERWVEGIFGLHARHLGNAVGYDTIAAGGDHANTLHWIVNDGDLANGDLLLMDAGVEVNSLYTADITRTLPISGRFTPEQRRVYEVVLAAQTAGIEACRAGNEFTATHQAAVAVLADFFEELGILPGTAAESLDPESGGFHRRWMVHGTSHHLGLDVHDCAQARAELYREGSLEPGMVITVEPGIYFKSTDLLVPEEYRGIGIRIEDDILITEDGPVMLSAALPRDPDQVEEWMASLRP